MKNTKIYILSFLISCATLFCYAKESEKTLLIFGAKWCKYCVKAKDDLKNNNNLSSTVKNYSIIDIDYDKDKDIIEGYNIKILPTFIIFQDGKEIKRQTGYKDPNKLLEFLK